MSAEPRTPSSPPAPTCTSTRHVWQGDPTEGQRCLCGAFVWRDELPGDRTLGVPYDPTTSPTHTDLMVSPEAIAAYEFPDTSDETDPYFVLRFARAAIVDAMVLEDGLDGATGQAVLAMIDASLATQPAAAPSSETPEPPKHDLTIDSVLYELDGAMHSCADQPFAIDSMTLTRSWRGILERFCAAAGCWTHTDDSGRLDKLEAILRPGDVPTEIYLAGLRRGIGEAATSFQVETVPATQTNVRVVSGPTLRAAIDNVSKPDVTQDTRDGEEWMSLGGTVSHEEDRLRTSLSHLGEAAQAFVDALGPQDAPINWTANYRDTLTTLRATLESAWEIHNV